MSVTGYQHRQSTIVFGALAVGVLTLAALPTAIGEPAALVWFIIPIAIVTAAATAFSAIDTTVDQEAVRAAFRFGWPARTIPLASISSHQPVRNSWWWGFGIRLVPGGWMYNVWGLDAIEIRYHDGGRARVFRIGTDDPQGLDAAITTWRRNQGTEPTDGS